MLKQFVHDNRFALAALVMLLLARIGFKIWAEMISAPPLDVPIAMSSKARAALHGADLHGADLRSVDQRIRIRVPDGYAMGLSFQVDQRGLDYLRGLVGDSSYDTQGERIPDGVRVPIRWSLSEADSGRIVAQGESETFGSSSGSSDQITREVSHFAAPPGEYRLQAQVLRDVPELADIQTRLAMRLNAKAVSSWQTSMVWNGSLLILLVIDPLMVLLVAFLSWRAIAGVRARRRLSLQPQA